MPGSDSAVCEVNEKSVRVRHLGAGSLEGHPELRDSCPTHDKAEFEKGGSGGPRNAPTTFGRSGQEL